MIKVYQTKFVSIDGFGDCFNSCVASILEKKLIDCYDVLPDSPGVWYRNWQKWLLERGWELELVSKANPPKGYGIVSILTERMNHEGNPISHACVSFSGAIVHDPYPSGSVVRDVLYYHSLDRIVDKK